MDNTGLRWVDELRCSDVLAIDQAVSQQIALLNRRRLDRAMTRIAVLPVFVVTAPQCSKPLMQSEAWQ